MPTLNPAQHKPSQRGFSLIEVMIVVAIIGILAAIAYPAYTSQVLKGRRSEARSSLMNLLQQQERYMTQNNSYAPVFAAGATGQPFKTFSGDSTSTSAYLLGARVCPGLTVRDCIEVFAQPQRADPQVNVIWLRSTGQRGCDGSNANLCWK